MTTPQMVLIGGLFVWVASIGVLLWVITPTVDLEPLKKTLARKQRHIALSWLVLTNKLPTKPSSDRNPRER